MFGFSKSSKSVSQVKSVKSVQRKACVVEGLEDRQLFSSLPFAVCATANRELIRVDVTTGNNYMIGRTSVTLFDLAINKSGQAYGVDGGGTLYRVNTDNAAVRRIGSLGRFANALTFGPDGRLYAAGKNALMTVNTSTGKSYLIGTMSNVTSAGDLAFDSRGYLYETTTSDKLLRINVAARTWVTVGSLGFHKAYGLGYYKGQMYGFSNSDGHAYKINLNTGHGTAVAQYSFNTIYDVGGINGTAFDPTW